MRTGIVLARLDCPASQSDAWVAIKLTLSFCGSSEKSPLAITLMGGASAGLPGGISAGCCSWSWWKGQSHPARCDRPARFPGPRLIEANRHHPSRHFCRVQPFLLTRHNKNFPSEIRRLLFGGIERTSKLTGQTFGHFTAVYRSRDMLGFEPYLLGYIIIRRRIAAVHAILEEAGRGTRHSGQEEASESGSVY